MPTRTRPYRKAHSPKRNPAANNKHTETKNRYKIGDSFFHLPLEQAQELLGKSTAKLEGEIEELEDKKSTIREEMTQLKVELYARFGKTINLET